MPDNGRLTGEAIHLGEGGSGKNYAIQLWHGNGDFGYATVFVVACVIDFECTQVGDFELQVVQIVGTSFSNDGELISFFNLQSKVATRFHFGKSGKVKTFFRFSSALAAVFLTGHEENRHGQCYHPLFHTIRLVNVRGSDTKLLLIVAALIK